MASSGDDGADLVADFVLGDTGAPAHSVMGPSDADDGRWARLGQCSAGLYIICRGALASRFREVAGQPMAPDVRRHQQVHG